VICTPIILAGFGAAAMH